MQKRLFLLLFPMMITPALLVMLVDWHNSRQQLAVLDGPGLVTSFDASLELARLVLEKEKLRAKETVTLIAQNPTLINSQTIWWIAQPGNSAAWELELGNGSQLPPDFTPSPDIFDPQKLIQPRRWKSARATYLLAGTPLNDKSGNWIIVAHTLPEEIDSLLDEISRGGAGVRQLRYFYSRLLRSNLVLTLGMLILLLAALSILLSHSLARYLARPLKKLTLATESVAAGDLTYQVNVSAPAEMGRLETAFNHMTSQLLQGREDLKRAERIAAWQGVAQRLAHEIKNPLTPITLAMHRIGRKSEDPTITACVKSVMEEAANLGRIADEFALYAKLPQPVPQVISARQLQEMFESLAQFYLARTRVKYGWKGWPGIFSLFVDKGQLRQVLSNLIKNGNEAMQSNGSLIFELSTIAEPGQKIATEHSGNWIRLRIQDTGPGLPENIDDIFEPYATTKPTGTGLGLAVARRIIEDNGGCLWAESGNIGAAFNIDLPDVSGPQENSMASPERMPS